MKCEGYRLEHIWHNWPRLNEKLFKMRKNKRFMESDKLRRREPKNHLFLLKG